MGGRQFPQRPAAGALGGDPAQPPRIAAGRRRSPASATSAGPRRTIATSNWSSTALANVMTRHSRRAPADRGFPRPRQRATRFRRPHRHPAAHRLPHLQTLVGSTGLNIVPLQTNVFSNCKSELKYFEAAIVETPTLATPTYSFRLAIDDGVNGYLVDAYDWERRLEQAVCGDLDLAGVAERGLEHTLRWYTPAAQVGASPKCGARNAGHRLDCRSCLFAGRTSSSTAPTRSWSAPSGARRSVSSCTDPRTASTGSNRAARARTFCSSSVPEGKSVKDRIHLDLRPDDQAAEVERLLVARRAEDRHRSG